MSCTAPPKIDIQGHRGCRGLYPENSLPAFKKAIDLGVNTLEMDISISKDNRVVVSHEPFMNPIICFNSNGDEIPEEDAMSYNLYAMDYEEIKKYDCGTKVHPTFPDQKNQKTFKPLLGDIFELVDSMNAAVRFNIELKSLPKHYGEYTPYPKEYVSIVLYEIEKSGFMFEVNLQSFDLNILEEIKIQSPKMPVALLVDEGENIDDKLLSLTYKPEIISPHYKLLTSDIVAEFQSVGYRIIPWTINDAKDLREMISFQVDGIITDYPDRLIKLLKI
ncbi:glycerophosphodiester phosphodiesterase family protein [Winogradskyella sp. A2]|uniref:glycerophosphodiester phosphodiesterase family protein n=1 Tax=Winogradskyella sp. A2 TaxID=3366944 RepID=UPI00398C42EB